jgi:peptide/nickel transport system substrate-binding protein
VLIQAQLARLGINATLEPVDNATAVSFRSTGGYQAIQDGQAFFVLDPGAYSTWFTCGAASAAAVGFCDEQLDTLLSIANQETDPASRKVLFQAYEERLLDLAPWIFEYWRPQAEAMAAYVKGYQRYEPGPIGLMSIAAFQTVWLDK